MGYRYMLLVVCLAALAAAACGGSAAPVAMSSPPRAQMASDEPATTENAPAAAADTAALPETTEPAAAVAAVAMETAVNDPPACFTLQGVNLRYGPGVSYEPVLRTLAATEALTPLAFSSVGYPTGQWVNVQVSATGEVGWVSAGAQYITCNFAINSLPPAANIPPTPTPAVPAPAPPSGAGGQTSGAVARPMNVEEKVTGGEVDFDPQIDFQYQFNNNFLLRLDIKNNHDQVDPDVNGRGISKVSFEVFSEATGQSVYQHEESTAGYCIFRGGEPDCRPWPQNGNGRYTWGDGGPEVEPGAYNVNVFIYPKNPEFDGQSWFWGSTFSVSP